VALIGVSERSFKGFGHCTSLTGFVGFFVSTLCLTDGESIPMAWTDDNLGRRRTPGYSYNSDQVQLRVDPRDQLDEEIYGLRGQVAKLKQVRFYFISMFSVVNLRT
jgi:hypothetical protein